jgi:hypothetical protein
LWSLTYGNATGTTFNTQATVATNATTDINQMNATLHGFIVYDGGGACNAGFYYDTTSGGTTHNVTVSGTFTTGQSFSKKITGLTNGTIYYASAWTSNSGGLSKANNEVKIITRPGAPTGFTGTANHSVMVLQWTNATVGANVTAGTMVRYKVGSPPTNITQGTLAYNGTNKNVTINISSDQHYYFSAWTWAADGSGLFIWSISYGILNITTNPIPPISVEAHPDINYINLTWEREPGYRTVVVRNASGYHGYPATPANGTIVYNGTGEYFKNTPLSQFTKYYYTLWTYNETTHLYSEPVYINDTTIPTSLNIDVSPISMDFGEVTIGSIAMTTGNHFNLTNLGMACNVDIRCDNTENWTYVNRSDVGHNAFSLNWTDNNWTSEQNIKLDGTNLVMNFLYEDNFYFDLKYILPTSTSILAKQNTTLTFTVTPS